MVSLRTDRTTAVAIPKDGMSQRQPIPVASGNLLSEISEHYQVVVVHGVHFGDVNSNSQITVPNITLDQKYELLLGIRPEISCSTINHNDNRTNFFAPSGLILTQGQITEASPFDIGSVIEGNDRRIPDSRLVEDVNPERINESIHAAITTRDCYNRMGKYSYNELLVERPSFGAIYYIANELTASEIATLQNIATKFKLPIIKFDCDNKGLDLGPIIEHIATATSPCLEQVNIEQTLASVIPAFRLRSASFSCVNAAYKAKELFYFYTTQKNVADNLTSADMKVIKYFNDLYEEKNVSLQAVQDVPERKLFFKISTKDIVTGDIEESLFSINVENIGENPTDADINFRTTRLSDIGSAIRGLDCKTIRPENRPKDLQEWVHILDKRGQDSLKLFHQEVSRIGLREAGSKLKRECRIPGAILHRIADLASIEGLDELANQARQAAVKMLSQDRYEHFMRKHHSAEGRLLLNPRHLILK